MYFSSPEFSKLVTVAKVDATANDVPEEIQGFPTIKLYPAGSKDSPVDYSGSRTIEDLANFIKSIVSEATEAVKTVAEDTDGEAGGEHDEL
jgi:protein disulfide-isomerase A1